MSEIPKAYEPQSVEDKWYAFWLKQNLFTADATSSKPPYSIVIPPPNVTGMLHMGHVLNNTIQDILSRKARMDGKEVLWLPGTDHAGIATQVQVERALKKEEKKTKHDLGREEFLKRVWAWKEKHGGIIIQQLKKLGCSCDWTRERFTMDPEYSRCVQKVFVELYRKGLIYRGKRMVNWCPATLTALSDEEVDMEPQKGTLWYFKVEVADNAGQASSLSKKPEDRLEACPTFLTIATTRPETIPGDTAVAVNPKDKRYAHLIGKFVVRPLPSELPREEKLIPIIADDYVDFEFGTGVLKVTPAHDKNDFEIGQRHKLAAVDIMNPDATMNDLAGEDLAGLDRFEARAKASELLRTMGALVKEEPYENKIGFSQRAKVPIEPRLSEQWFLKYPSVEKSKACVEQRSLLERPIQVVTATGKELPGKSIRELRHAANAFARAHGIIGRSFKNPDSGIEIRVGRQSLTHAFSHLGVANIKAVVVLPQLIQNAIWLSSQAHNPPNPIFKQVHRFIAALLLGGELHQILITAKEFWNGTILYDHKAKKITPGGKSLEAHPREGKLDTQPAPSAGVTVGDLLEGVNAGKMRLHPDRWAKVYDHWLTNIQDWCISRQLWWGHRIPVWRHKYLKTDLRRSPRLGEAFLPVEHVSWMVENRQIERFGLSEKQAPTHRGGTYWWRVVADDEDLIEIEAVTESDTAAEFLVQQGFTQDPDVLDTWFSSWLWPFATMGWTNDKETDAKNETLKKFYPTTDLVTGPDIIFFWVARMIMAGYEFMGDLPFRNVYFTGIIRDKQGRKMSKTLGNSPDPLELIAKYGADALRFGTMRSAPLGQDVLFDEKDVELGRNFCNKLWNACRFRQMVGQASGLSSSPTPNPGTGRMPVPPSPTFEVQGEIQPRLLTTYDKWILLKLDQAIREISSALNEYKFNEAATVLYRFFWSEYCDWYVEASKAILSRPASVVSASPLGGERAGERGGAPAEQLAIGNRQPAIQNEGRRANTLAVIDFVLSHTLRLFHPFLPFITEELWHGMGYAEDMPEDQGGKTILFAPWPKPLDDDFKGHYGLDDCYVEMVDAKYDLVTQGRNLRREANIPSGKKVKFIFKPTQHLGPHDAEVLTLLLNAESFEVNAEYQPPKGTPTVQTPLGELCLPLEGLVDVAAEKARLSKELEKIETEISKAEQKLANPNFTQKAPPQVLQEHQKRLAEWQVKREHVKSALKALEG